MYKRNPMKDRMVAGTIYLVVLVIISSCSNRNLVYFSDLAASTSSDSPIKNTIQLKIQPDDLLSITVSSLNTESNILFNNIMIPSAQTTTGNISRGINE